MLKNLSLYLLVPKTLIVCGLLICVFILGFELTSSHYSSSVLFREASVESRRLGFASHRRKLYIRSADIWYKLSQNTCSLFRTSLGKVQHVIINSNTWIGTTVSFYITVNVKNKCWCLIWHTTNGQHSVQWSKKRG